MNILSIQSHVVFGHVGNAAAVFPMQLLGAEVWPIHTVQFSNHPGYGDFRGQVFDAALIRDLVDGLGARGVLGRCDAVLSGYMGTRETAHAIRDAVRTVKAANPAAIYACDPVLGDVGPGVYVRAELAAYLRDHLVGAADIVTPNQFELEFLCGQSAGTRAGLRDALANLHARGPTTVLATSVVLEDTPADRLDMVVSAPAGQFRLRTPRLNATINGAGDAVAALFLVHFLKSGDAALALQQAGSSIFGVIRRSLAAGSRELLMIEAQDEFVSPYEVFDVSPF